MVFFSAGYIFDPPAMPAMNNGIPTTRNKNIYLRKMIST